MPGTDAAKGKLWIPLPDELLERIEQRAAEKAAEIVAAGENRSPWLDTRGAAEYLSAKPQRIHDLVQLGKLKPRRDGRRLLFRPEDLDAYLEDGR
jgi:excisionase family DNA binding protein